MKLVFVLFCTIIFVFEIKKYTQFLINEYVDLVFFKKQDSN